MSSVKAPAPGNVMRHAPGATEFALLAALSLAWGTSYMFTKIAVAAVSPVTLIAVRAVVASVVMLGVMSARGGWPRMTRRDVGAFALVGLLSNAAPLCLIAVSVSYVHSSVTATTMSMVPLLTAVFAGFRGERPSLRVVLGIAVGLLGVAVLYGPEAFATFGDSARGLVAALSASVIFAVSLFTAVLVARHEPVAVATFSLISAAIWSTLAAFVIDDPIASLPGTGVLAAVGVLALWNTAGASLLLFALLPRAGPAFTSYNNYLVPAVAVACGAIFLGEVLTVRSVAGVVLVLCGVAICTLRRRPAVPAAPDAGIGG